MNGKAARTLRRFLNWSGIDLASEHRARKRAYLALDHRTRGKTRRRMVQAMAKDPRPLPTARPTPLHARARCAALYNARLAQQAREGK